jgi:DNA invertase Pin-like site-specific DNA recombinase
VFEDRVSGSTDPADRPGWRQLRAYARSGDTITVYRLDRCARSLRSLLATVDQLEALDLHFESLSESFDTSTPTGKLMIGLLGAVAEFERSIITERVRSGLSAARERNGGVNPGDRPRALSGADLDDALAIVQAGRARGDTSRAIAERIGISRATLYRIVAAARTDG